MAFNLAADLSFDDVGGFKEGQVWSVECGVRSLDVKL